MNSGTPFRQFPHLFFPFSSRMAETDFHFQSLDYISFKSNEVCTGCKASLVTTIQKKILQKVRGSRNKASDSLQRASCLRRGSGTAKQNEVETARHGDGGKEVTIVSQLLYFKSSRFKKTTNQTTFKKLTALPHGFVEKERGSSHSASAFNSSSTKLSIKLTNTVGQALFLFFLRQMQQLFKLQILLSDHIFTSLQLLSNQLLVLFQTANFPGN